MSHRLHHLAIPVATALAVGATALPAAARPDSDSPAPGPTQLPSSLHSAGGQDANIAALGQTAPRPNVVTVRTTTSDGFDWGDAGIGAGGAIGLLVAGLGGTLVITHRRTSHAKAGPRPLAS